MASDIYDRVSPEVLAGMLVSGASFFVRSVTKSDGREVNIQPPVWVRVSGEPPGTLVTLSQGATTTDVSRAELERVGGTIAAGLHQRLARIPLNGITG